MPICDFCGALLMKGSKICYKCETKLEVSDDNEEPDTSWIDSIKTEHDLEIKPVESLFLSSFYRSKQVCLHQPGICGPDA